MEKISSESLNVVEMNINKLKELFPNVVSDGKIDYDLLKSLFAGEIDESNEKYTFSWNGKNNSIKLSQIPSTGTLLPLSDKSIQWDRTKNLYIEGDNLEVLKLLQKTYFNKIKLIYIDPPYNTGHDFVYKDNFVDSIENYKEITGQINRANPDTNGRYHTDWLNMIYPRLILARNLLRDDGIICISIDDHEIANLINVCNLVFGENNKLGIFARVTKKAGKSAENISNNHDYIVMYSKTNCPKLFNFVHVDKDFKYEDEYVETRGKYKLNQTLDYDTLGYVNSLDYPITIDGKTYYAGNVSEDEYLKRKQTNPKDGFRWRWSKELFDFGYKNGFIVIKNYSTYSRIYTKTYLNCTIEENGGGYYIDYQQRTKSLSTLEFIENIYSNDNAKKNQTAILGKSYFEYSKPIELLKKIIRFSCRNDIVLDFFSGTGTTAQAVLEVNKEDNMKNEFILVQLPEICSVDSTAYQDGFRTICDIGEERVRKSSELIYKELLEKYNNAGLLFDDCINPDSLDLGFKVFKLESTNIRPWDGNVKIDEQTLFDFTDTIKEDRTNLDVAYEIMLKYGIFNMPLKEVQINNKTMYNIGDGYMIICLDNEINTDDITEIARQKPHCVVFKEKGFEDDNVKINATYTLERLGVEDVKCI